MYQVPSHLKGYECDFLKGRMAHQGEDMSVLEEDDWHEYFVKCFASLKLGEFVVYASNLHSFILCTKSY